MLQIITYFLPALIAVIVNLFSLAQKQMAAKNSSYLLLSIQLQRNVGHLTQPITRINAITLARDLVDLPTRHRTIGTSIPRNNHRMRLPRRTPLHTLRTRRKAVNLQISIRPVGGKTGPAVFLIGTVNKTSLHQEALRITLTAATASSCRMPLRGRGPDLNVTPGLIF